jgi:adenylate kinase family enzyme
VDPKIAVIGGSCSGKTTLAGGLAERLGVPHIELDALNHLPNWGESTPEELRQKIETTLAPLDGWVVDGGYIWKIGTLVLDRADTVVWLDLPLAVCVRRLWHRSSSRIRARTELWGTGNRETWGNNLLLFLYTVSTRRRQRREWAKLAPGRLVRLRSEDEVSRWLAGQPPPPAPG